MPATFADQKMPFPLYDAPIATASGFLPSAFCSLCGRLDTPGFRLGIGDYLMQSCRNCGSAVGFAVDEPAPNPVTCLICGVQNEFAGTPMPKNRRQICYPCLREGKAALTKDTEFGMVGWEEAVMGVTHGLPQSALPYDSSGFDVVEKEQDWAGVRVPAEHLWELLRTPAYTTWQGGHWCFCSSQPMVYWGEWKKSDWNRAATDGDGEALFKATVEDLIDDAWQGLDDGMIVVYVFACPSDGSLKAHWDCAKSLSH